MSIAERNRNVRSMIFIPTGNSDESYEVVQMRNIVEYPIGFWLTKESVNKLIEDGVDVVIKGISDPLDLGDLV